MKKEELLKALKDAMKELEEEIENGEEDDCVKALADLDDSDRDKMKWMILDEIKKSEKAIIFADEKNSYTMGSKVAVLGVVCCLVNALAESEDYKELNVKEAILHALEMR